MSKESGQPDLTVTPSMKLFEQQPNVTVEDLRLFPALIAAYKEVALKAPYYTGPVESRFTRRRKAKMEVEANQKVASRSSRNRKLQ